MRLVLPRRIRGRLGNGVGLHLEGGKAFWTERVLGLSVCMSASLGG